MVSRPPPSSPPSPPDPDKENSYVNKRNLFKPAPEPVPLYYPTIFRYKCRGGFSISSDDAIATGGTSNHNHPQHNSSHNINNNNRGYCLGIQTQLQHVRDLHKSTESESIHMFLQDYVPPSSVPPGSSHRDDTATVMSSSSSVPPVSDILDTPAIIFPFQPRSNQKQKIYHHDQDEHATSAAGVGSESHTNTPSSISSESTDDTTPTTWHDWSAYGSTDVRVLVLRNTKTNEERTVAVAPYTRLGLSIRDVGDTASGEGDTVATLRVGPVEVVMRNNYILEGDHLEQERHGRNKNNNHLMNNSKEANVTQPHNILSNNKNINDATAVENNTLSTNRSISAMTFINGGKMVYEQSVKIGKAMQTNATILRDAVQEDFPQRCLDSSQRIVKEFGNTVQKTSDLMKSLYELWKDDDE